MNQNEILSGLIANAVIITAHLANEICVQTQGQYIIPEEDYLHLVKDFQVSLAKRIMPVKSRDDIKEEAKKFITALMESFKKGDEDGLSDGATAQVTRNDSDDRG
jgi:hypothetical protein